MVSKQTDGHMKITDNTPVTNDNTNNQPDYSFFTYYIQPIFRKEDILKIWPDRKSSSSDKINSASRFIIIATLVGYIATRSHKITATGIVAISVLFFLKFQLKARKEELTNKNCETFLNPSEYYNRKHEYVTPTKENPLMNVIMTDYIDNPDRKEAAPAYNPTVEQEINDVVKEQVSDNLGTDRVFRDLGDNLTFENSMRNFHAMPNTTIPNDLEEYKKFCYEGLISDKEVENSVGCN